MEETKESNYLDTSKLQPGMIVKNYKELCALLGEEAKDGNSKKSQLKEWSKYFNYQKIGKSQKYYIIEIHPEPLDIPETKGRPPIYLNDCKTLLLQNLAANDGSISHSRRMWYYLLGLVNNEYVKYNIQNNAQLNDKMPAVVSNLIYSKSLSIYDYTTYTLIKNGLIISGKEIICDNKCVCTDDIATFINESENYILFNTFNYKSLNMIYLTLQSHKFYEMVNNLLKEKYGYENYYKSYRLTLTDKGKEIINHALDGDIRKTINKKVVDYYSGKFSGEKLEYINNYVKI